jgi:CubicO group peptidase (beta-lactamase class C family)
MTVTTGLENLSSAEPLNVLPDAARRVLDDLMAASLQAGVFPAAAITAVHDGQALLNAAWGYNDPDTCQHPTRPDTLFDLASITKLFTVTACLRLVSAHDLPLDTPLVAIVPAFGESGPRPVDGGMDPHSKAPLPVPAEAAGQMVDPAAVTLWHLLTHTSGIAPWRDVFSAAGPPPPPPDQPDPAPRARRWDHALRALCAYPFVSAPDGVVRYSDLGLMLLGEAVSRLNSTPGDLEQAVRSQALQPLGLDTVMYNPARSGRPQMTIAPAEHDPAWRGRRIWGEVHDENACGVGGVAGHAGLFAAARDVAALGQAWLDDDPRLGIAQALLDDARREQARNGFRFGLGWMLRAETDSSASELFSERSYGHTGFTGTSLWVDPVRRLVVACLTNRVYPGRDKAGIHEFRRAVHELLARAVNAG